MTLQAEEGQALPGNMSLVEVAADATERALRPLPFDAARHVLLSEELKHLYTACTRAKKNGVSCA